MTKGHVETPSVLAEEMVFDIFQRCPITPSSKILYPGSGTGPFPLAVSKYCSENDIQMPDGVAVEKDSTLVDETRQTVQQYPIDVVEDDFLLSGVDTLDSFTHVIGNPPYVSIENISESLKPVYRDEFMSSNGRFDLYFLFFEKSLELLEPGGILAFVTPEKYEYVESASKLRQLLAQHYICEIRHIDEQTFPNHVAYPSITMIAKQSKKGKTQITLRNGDSRKVSLPTDGGSWANTVRGGDDILDKSPVTLEDVCRRIGCGSATGADNVFIRSRSDIPEELYSICHPTVAGEDIQKDTPRKDILSNEVIVCPYDEDGLVDDSVLTKYTEWLSVYEEELRDRWCVTEDRSEWFEWHETPPIEDILTPKIICQDITDDPFFWFDEHGDIFPQHSTYYIVPDQDVDNSELIEYLNSSDVRRWLYANCQKASDGFLRVQSSTLKQLPVPKKFTTTYQSRLF